MTSADDPLTGAAEGGQEERGLRSRITSQAEDTIGKLADDLLENPVFNSALTSAFATSEPSCLANLTTSPNSTRRFKRSPSSSMDSRKSCILPEPWSDSRLVQDSFGGVDLVVPSDLSGMVSQLPVVSREPVSVMRLGFARS